MGSLNKREVNEYIINKQIQDMFNTNRYNVDDLSKDLIKYLLANQVFILIESEFNNFNTTLLLSTLDKYNINVVKRVYNNKLECMVYFISLKQQETIQAILNEREESYGSYPNMCEKFNKMKELLSDSQVNKCNILNTSLTMVMVKLARVINGYNPNKPELLLDEYRDIKSYIQLYLDYLQNKVDIKK